MVYTIIIDYYCIWEELYLYTNFMLHLFDMTLKFHAVFILQLLT